MRTTDMNHLPPTLMWVPGIAVLQRHGVRSHVKPTLSGPVIVYFVSDMGLWYGHQWKASWQWCFLEAHDMSATAQ